MVKGLEKRRILIHSLTFYPDQVSTASLYFEIAKYLVCQGAKTTVFTTYPHYNPDPLFKKKSKWFLFYRKSTIEGIQIIHIYQKKTKSIFLRALLLFYFHFCFSVWAIFRFNFDLVLTPSPPLTSGLLSGIAAKMHGSKSIYNVQEIHPDMLTKQSRSIAPLMPVLKKIEKLTYKFSDKLVTIHDLFSQTISKRTDENKIVAIPNFENGGYTDLSDRHELESASNEKHTFVLGYFGNIGFLQDWDLLIQAIEELKLRIPIALLLIGGGAEYKRLHSLSHSLDFLTVLPYVDKAELNSYVHNIDAHLIAMTAASDKDGLPSKVFSLLGVGVPIIAVTNSDSPLSDILIKSRNAVISPLGDREKLKENILSVYKKRVDFDTKFCKRFIRENYSKEVVLNSYVRLIQTLISTKQQDS